LNLYSALSEYTYSKKEISQMCREKFGLVSKALKRFRVYTVFNGDKIYVMER